jgi:hypothetical protein
MFDDRKDDPGHHLSRKIQLPEKSIREVAVEKLKIHFEKFYADATIDQLASMVKLTKILLARSKASRIRYA